MYYNSYCTTTEIRVKIVHLQCAQHFKRIIISPTLIYKLTTHSHRVDSECPQAVEIVDKFP